MKFKEWPSANYLPKPNDLVVHFELDPDTEVFGCVKWIDLKAQRCGVQYFHTVWGEFETMRMESDVRRLQPALWTFTGIIQLRDLE